MTLRHFDGPSLLHTTAASLPLFGPYTAYTQDAPTVETGGPWASTYALKRASWVAGVKCTFDAQSTWVVGWRWYVPSLANLDDGTHILPDQIAFYDGSDLQCSVKLKTDGTLQLVRGDGTVLATSTVTVSLNAWHYYEVKATLHGTTGLLAVRKDGTVIATYSGDTTNTANNTANVIHIGNSNGHGGTSNDLLADIYVLDAQGSGPDNNYLGDVRVYPGSVSGAGSVTGWTPNTGANYAAVDETGGSDEDSTYVEAAAASGLRDTYALANLPSGVFTVFGVRALIRARKTDAGAANVAPVLRQGSTNYDGTSQAPSTSYGYHQQVYATQPSGAGVWTTSTANALEAGVGAPA